MYVCMYAYISRFEPHGVKGFARQSLRSSYYLVLFEVLGTLHVVHPSIQLQRIRQALRVLSYMYIVVYVYNYMYCDQVIVMV